VKSPRPVNLNLLQIRFPVPAIASILHRASGVLLLLLLPFLLWMLQGSLASDASFMSLHDSLQQPVCKFVFWILLSGLLYHVLAGLRHLIMDMGIGESLRAGRATAWSTIVLGVVGSVLLGVWLW
jgi:succinate dehydrogenase / fumarate reductase cytochrome b subunit